MKSPPVLTPQDASRLIDITGPENTLILLAAPGDEVTAWQLAKALAGDIELPLLALLPMTALPGPAPKQAWRLDVRQWDDRKAMAGLAHGYKLRSPGFEVYGRLP